MFSIHQSVMLLIDVQGRLAQLMYDKDTLFKHLELMIQSMKILGVPIIWMEQIPEKLGRTTEHIAALMTDSTPIEKFSFSCCQDPAFMAHFNALGRTQVFLTGIETHICVFQTGHDLIKQGCQVQVVTDCVSSREQSNKALGINRLSQLGAVPTSLEMALFELMRAAEGEPFRQIVKLIK